MNIEPGSRIGIAQSLRVLYEAAQAQPPSARAEWLIANCTDLSLRARVQRLLDANEQSLGPLARGAQDRLNELEGDAVPNHAAGAMVGRRYGAFRLLKPIGQGGMATVYLAERCEGEFVQRAAVKLLRRTTMSGSERRAFARERKLLASLEHPHIARLIDGGVTADDEPFLVMEYVEGLTITEHAFKHAMSLGARIVLLIEVCQAVAAAHAQLIVHRDLKPSNVLIGADGHAKLLDFGVAKLLDDDSDQTQQGYAGFTPGYAAPEQFVGGHITTATDVYALGVLSLELLIGYRPGLPLTSAPSESAMLAPSTNEATPVGPRQVTRFLRGDLDNILRMCLNEEPARRYQSAAALAEDLQRFQRQEPVSAHPPSRWYRTQKFVARHRGGVLLTVLFALATVTSLGLALWQAQRAKSEATRAIAAEQRALVVKDFLMDMLRNAQAEMPRDEKPTPEAMALAAGKQLETRADLAPQDKIELLVTLADVAVGNNALANAYELLDRADRLADTLAHESSTSRLARSLVRANALLDEDKRADARALLLSVLPLARAERSEESRVILTSLGELESNESHVELSLAYLTEAQAHAREIYQPRSRELLHVDMYVGSALMVAQQAARAVESLEPALAAWKSEGYGDDAYMVMAMSNLATAKAKLGDTALAARMDLEVLAIKRRIYPAPNKELIVSITNVATDALAEGRFEQARSGYAESLAMSDALFGAHSPDGFHTRVQIALAARAERDFDGAERVLREVLDDCRSLPTHNVCPRAHFFLGLILTEREHPELGLPVLRDALQEVVALRGADHPQVAAAYTYIALTELALARPVEALAALDRAHAIFELMQMSESLDMLYAQELRARAFLAQGRVAEALAIMQPQLVFWREHNPHLKPRYVTKLLLCARLLDRTGRRDAAVALAREAQGQNMPREFLAPEDAQTMDQLLAVAAH